MKKVTFLLALAAAFTLSLTFTSCDEKENLDKEQASDNIKAYLPIEYANKQVAAWYMLTDQSDNKTKIEAVFLFTDSTLAVTKVKFYSESDGRKPEYDINATGRYKIKEGDYTTGKADVITSGGDAFEVNIKNGILYAMNEEFTKMSNSLLPSAYNPNGGGNNNQGGGNNQGGDNNNLDPFFPKSYEDKNISAWYSYSATEAAQGYEFKRTAAVYLFEDNTYVATINMSTSNPQHGQHSSCMIVSEGTYQKVEGNFTTGKITITDDKNSMTVEIQDGQLKIKDTETPEVSIYFKQDNSKLPQPSEPTENGNQGGDINHSTDTIYSKMAYFPAKFAQKELDAWYTLVDQTTPQELRVEAIFLFKDNTFAVTEFKAHYGVAAQKPEYYIHAEGTFSVTTGDYANGWASISPNNGNPFDVKIQNGELYKQNSTYYLQGSLPQITELDDNNGGDDNGGEVIIPDSLLNAYAQLAFYPNAYSDKKIAAWFMAVEQEKQALDVTSLFFFTDNTSITTVSSIGTAFGMEKFIASQNSYRIDGTFEKGKISVVDDGQIHEANIDNGILNADGDIFYKMDISYLPEPSDSISNNNGGDDNGGGNGGDDNGGGQIDNGISGMWINDLANPYTTLTLNADGTGSMGTDEKFKYSYNNGILIYDRQSLYRVDLSGDIMTWSYIEEDSTSTLTDIWYKVGGTFNKKPSTGRWNGYMGENSDHGIVYIFGDSLVDIYIIAWGEHLKGAYAHINGTLFFNLIEGYKAKFVEDSSWWWEAGNLDAETLKLTEGCNWYKMDEEVFNERKQEISSFTFALGSDTKAYGGLFGRSMIIEKAGTK